jgi:hypothetical protein
MRARPTSLQRLDRVLLEVQPDQRDLLERRSSRWTFEALPLAMIPRPRAQTPRLHSFPFC